MLVAVALVLVFAARGRADEDGAKAARATIDKAVKALGGDNLAKMKSATWKMKGKITPNADVVVTTSEDWSFKGMDKIRVDVSATVNGNNVGGTLVINGAKAWGKGPDKTNEVPKDAAAAIYNVMRAGRIVHQLASLKDKPFELSPLGELKIGDQETVGVGVKEKGRPDISIYFDKKTGLPAKCEVRVAETDGGQEVLFEILLSEYKDFDGINHPTKMVLQREGKVFLESEVSDIKPQDLDDGVFDKP
jgi:hypothetical protein